MTEALKVHDGGIGGYTMEALEHDGGIGGYIDVCG